eukprot:6458232-Amphidinium_carterae.1
MSNNLSLVIKGLNNSHIRTDRYVQRLHHVGRHLYLSATVIPGHHKEINITDPTLIGAIHNLPSDFMLQGVTTNDQVELNRKGIKPESPDTPIKPSDEEVRQHQLTHIPYRSWCEVCNKSR